ncbi:MAG: hypothetical protein KA716_02625 [Gloeotrichia echinulata DEX184]|nr:hypothetical protein [Gloeotrichia echinulata DEX184]
MIAIRVGVIDILPDLKVQGFWIQTAIAGIARLTSPSPTDNALPVATILPKSRPRRTAALDPVFLVTSIEASTVNRQHPPLIFFTTY